VASETFRVQNVKCGGCVKTIRDGLATVPGVDDVEVIQESGAVTVQGDTLVRTQLAAKLKELGYPEAQ